MRLRTAHKRRRRHIWNTRGHTHLVFNRGVYMRLNDEEWGPFWVLTNGLEQPRAYRKYPQP